MINLNTMVFLPYSLSPVCEESPQFGASRPYNDVHKRNTEVREESNTHKTQICSTTTHTGTDPAVGRRGSSPPTASDPMEPHYSLP
jgi:hypothetical protein